MQNLKIINIKELWQVYKEDPYVDTRGNIIGTVFVLKCKKCGDLKAKIVINTNLYGR